MSTETESAKSASSWLRRGVLGFGVVLSLGLGCYAAVSYYVVSETLKPNPIECIDRTPNSAGLQAEELRFLSQPHGLWLHGWLLPSWGSNAIVLIHGLDSYSWDWDLPDIAKAYVEAGFHVLVFDLRAHGRSDGDRLGLGWHEKEDVRAAVALLLARGFASGRIGVHGGSYGAVVALLSTATIPEIGAALVDSAFADVRDIMDVEVEKAIGIPASVSRKILRPGIAAFARWSFGLNFDIIAPELAVPAIAPRPILFIHGTADNRIPLSHSRRLIAAAKNPAAQLWELEGAGHTEGVRVGWKRCEQGEYSATQEMFLRRAVQFFESSLG